MKDTLTKYFSKVKPFHLLFVLALLLAAGFGVFLSRSNFSLELPSSPLATKLTFPPNTTIVMASGNFAYQNLTNKFQTQFKETPTATESIVFSNDLGEISFFTPSKQVFGELKATTTIAEGSTITYGNIFPQVDLRYTVSSTRLLEEFIVKDPATAKKITRIDQQAKTDSTYIKNTDGSLTFEKNGQIAFTLPRPIIYEVGDPTKRTIGINYEVTEKNNQFTISKVLNSTGQAWLADPTRKYPIAIDLVIDNADTVADWTSSDSINSAVSQDTIVKQEGTSSVKVTTTAEGSTTTVDLMEYSSNANAQAAFVTNSLVATGGTITTSGTDTIHTYTSSGTFTPNSAGNVRTLVVGGGSPGKVDNINNAGGGAGQFRDVSSVAVLAQAYPVTVGLATQNSVFSTITSVGVLGRTSGNGYIGGVGIPPAGGPGGGGSAGNGAGGNGAYAGGAGGAGTTSNISGASVCYAGGGGGGGTNGGGAGICGGGAGGPRDWNGFPAGANTGSGGGGVGTNMTVGGAGGSGIVIIRLPNPSLQSYSEPTIKSQGTYSLRGYADTTAINKTLTRTIGSPLNLTNLTRIKFDIRSTRTGSNLKVGIRDIGGTITEVTPNITGANVFQSVTMDLSGVINADKDAIYQIIITVVNAAAVNTFYIDNIVADLTSQGNTITRTTSPTDLSSVANITYWVRSSVAGTFATFGFGEAAASEQTNAITISQVNTWEQKTWDISSIPAASRNAVTKFAFTFTANTTGALFYFDDIQTNALFAPTLGAATSLSSTSIRWLFTDNSPEETGFNILNSTGTAIQATCATENLAYCDEAGLSPNTQYTRKINTYKLSPAIISTASGTVSTYTLAALPSAPVITSRTGTTAIVNITAGTNPASTEYAIYREAGTTCDGAGGVYLADNGSSNGATAVWVTDNNWGTANDGTGVTATGLNSETAYTFCIKARNTINVETNFSSGGAGDSGYIPLSGDFVNTISTANSVNKYVSHANAARYIIGLDKVGANDTNTAVLELRSGIFTVNSNETLVTGTMTLTGGSISIAIGGEIKPNTPLWALDTDNDGFTSNNQLAFGTKPSDSWKRKSLLSTLATADCNDNFYDLTNVTVGNSYVDADGDGYGTGNLVVACANNGYSLNNTDCNDANPAVSRTISPARYLDADGDGYGVGSLTSCAPQTGNYTASVANDCGPNTATAYPGSATCSSTSFLNASSATSYDYNCSASGGAGTLCGTSLGTSPTAATSWPSYCDDNSCYNETAYTQYGVSGTGSVACGSTGYYCSSYINRHQCPAACGSFPRYSNVADTVAKCSGTSTTTQTCN